MKHSKYIKENKFPIIVMKIGGSVVGDPPSISFISKRIKTYLEKMYRVVVVVSAIRKENFSHYSTDALLSLLPEEKYVCRRERDLLLSVGEIISTVLFAAFLRKEGIAAVGRAGFEAGIITNNEHGNAKIISVETQRLMHDLQLYSVVVVAGFQGISELGRITTLGRGGSDTTALALGAALNAKQVEIFTDTSGIFSADPHVVPNARHLQIVNTEDIRQMAWQQKHVLHPRASEIAVKYNVPLLIRSPFDISDQTIIHPDYNRRDADRKKSFEPECMITGIALGNKVAQFIVPFPHGDSSFSAEIFQTIADIDISMDMFTITETDVRFTISHDTVEKGTSALKKKGFNPMVRNECIKISIVGAGMHGMKGVMARFMRRLVSSQVEVFQTVDSHATISALIPFSKKAIAARALHAEFIECNKKESNQR